MKLSDFKAALIVADPTASHYSSTKKENYTVWHEYGTNDFVAGDKKAASAWKVQIDRYTQNEDDPVVAAISAMLDDNHIVPEYQPVPNDPRQGTVHHIWQIEVV